MRRSVLSLAVLCGLTAGPVLAQQAEAPRGTLRESQLAQVRDVLTAAQQRLQDLGYNATPTGRFDAATGNAVLRFQADHGLRPTGNIDLATIAALGLDVQPAGSVSMLAPEPGSQLAMLPPESEAEQLAETRYRTAPAYNQPILHMDEHDQAPQVRGQASELQILGVPELLVVSRDGRIAGLPPGYPTEDIVR